MMTELKILAQIATVPTGPAVMAYTVPTGKALTVKAISLTNANVAARTTNVYVRVSGSGASRRIWPKDLSIAPNAQEVRTVPWCLSAGDAIEWDASGANVEGIISGVVSQAQ